MCNHRIIPINDGFDRIIFPPQEASISFFLLLEHKTQPRIVALVFEAGKAVSSALETDTTCFSQTDAVESLIRTGPQLLRQGGIQVISDPICTQRDRNR